MSDEEAAGELPPEAKPVDGAPSDGVTGLKYVGPNLLASTSWDGCLKVHDTAKRELVFSKSLESGPLLSLASSSNGDGCSIFAGAMDGSIHRIDLENLSSGGSIGNGSTTSRIIGQHQPANDHDGGGGGGGSGKVACSCLCALNDGNMNVVASAGWHGQFHIWDLRLETCGDEDGERTSPVAPRPATTIELPGKAFDMDVDPTHKRFVVATSGRRNCFIDIRNPSEAEIVLDRESSLKFQTRTVRFFRPDGVGIAVGSVEARVGIEYLDELGVPAPKGHKKYAFKCHRANDRIFPVNCIEFHPKYGTFATGGCDGTVVLWDGLNKKKLTTLPPFPTSVAALAFDPTGTELAIASSYTYEGGEREHPRDEIYIRPVLDSECRPKGK